jgi:hypothetical protein
MAFANPSILPSVVAVQCDKCLTQEQYNQVISQLQDLVTQNTALIAKVKQLEEIQAATPNLKLDPITIVVDESGRVFITDKVNGKLQIATLSYDVSMKLDTTILQPKQKEYGFALKYKAAVIENYEKDSKGELKSYTSGALVIEPFYYHSYSLNLVMGPRLYGPAVGIDLTQHFGALIGIGFEYSATQTFFFGGAFDF